MRDKNTGRVKGFGFVKYSTQAEAEKAIKAMDGRVCVPLDNYFGVKFDLLDANSYL
jgi:RNA recognition motif-containing protein